MMPETKTFNWIETSEQKTAYIVMGAEGSGTTMMTEALVFAGCHWSQKHESLLANHEFEKEASPFVFHRSIPHAGVWPTSIDYCAMLRSAGFFDIYLLFMTRDINATNQSIRKRGGEDNLYRHNEIYRQMGMYLDSVHVGFVPISYEAFTTSKGFRRWLFEERLGLPFPADFEVHDENKKYYHD